MASRFLSLLITCAATAASTLTVEAAGDATKGKVIYDGIGACSACHGATGGGDGAASAALDPKPRQFSAGVFMFDTDGDGKKGTPADLKNIVSKGATGYGGSLMMTARPDIQGADLDDLVAYVLQLAGK